MKDEIKEILDKLKDSVDNPTSIEVDPFTEEADYFINYFVLDPTTNESKQLLDYITNLQEENKILNKGIEYAKRIEKDYKKRFDNAIELIKDTKEYFHDGIDEELLDILEKRL